MDSMGQYITFEDYLDAQVSETDMYYLEDEDLARQLVELGYRGSGDTLTREEFDAQRKLLKDRTVEKTVQKRDAIGPTKKNLGPFLTEISNREDMIISGERSTIIFIRCLNAKGQEVSGYLDLGARLKTDNFEAIYEGKKKLLPRPTDLSYYNWEAQTSSSNSTPNFQVITDNESGLLFKNTRDRKVIDVDPQRAPGDNTTRHNLGSMDGYLQVVIFDHSTRKK